MFGDVTTTALAPYRIFTEPQQGATYDDLLAVALRSEVLGFGAFFRSDHYLKMGSVSGEPGPSDAWVTLGGLARDTTTIRLGTLVTAATFRHPGPLAISVANVDQMSGGRIELGLGAGWYEAEHTAYGIPFPALGERFDRFTEQLAIIDGMWRTPAGESFSYSGNHWSLTDSPALPKPVQTGGIPIIIGGGAPSEHLHSPLRMPQSSICHSQTSTHSLHKRQLSEAPARRLAAPPAISHGRRLLWPVSEQPKTNSGVDVKQSAESPMSSDRTGLQVQLISLSTLCSVGGMPVPKGFTYRSSIFPTLNTLTSLHHY